MYRFHLAALKNGWPLICPVIFAEKYVSPGKTEMVTVGKEKIEGQNKNIVRRI